MNFQEIEKLRSELSSFLPQINGPPKILVLFSFYEKYLIDKLIQGELQQNELIGLCSKIALSVLRKRYESYSHRFLTQGLTFQDFVTGALAPLFTTVKYDDEFPKQRALKKWSEPIDSEEAAYFFRKYSAAELSKNSNR